MKSNTTLKGVYVISYDPSAKEDRQAQFAVGLDRAKNERFMGRDLNPHAAIKEVIGRMQSSWRSKGSYFINNVRIEHLLIEKGEVVGAIVRARTLNHNVRGLVMPEELPAVCTCSIRLSWGYLLSAIASKRASPMAAKAGGKFARPSSVLSGRTCSS